MDSPSARAFGPLELSCNTSKDEAILKSLGLATRAPPIAPARTVSADWTLAEPSAIFGNYVTRPAAGPDQEPRRLVALVEKVGYCRPMVRVAS